MDLIYAMRTFVAVIDGGSFTAAAERLDTSGAAVSRQVAALEDHLGARLLHRTTRRLSVSEPGQVLYERALQILGDVADTEAMVGQHSAMPSGVLRISAPLSFGIGELAGVLPGFRERYPNLRLDIDLTDRIVDLAHEGMDVALRIVRPLNQSLIARRIAAIEMMVCAAPSYLERRGMPQAPADLEHHEVLSYSYLSCGDNWTFRDAGGAEVTVRVRPWVHATNGDLLRELAIAGCGIIIQPDFIVARDIAAGRLTPLLQGWRMDDFHLYAVYLSRKFLSPKVRLFIDYLAETIGKARGQ
ncbi:LysR family transcriptional regulator [Bosea sp. F3-2]|uniref:LysR family transcriptional regulator n=1 Tax=Bosea sp. F3-2 TaxID=2599640 RepID=UPI0011EBF0C4|nr:LysR family transcriptional regulator [Bosea sp. F3-2]QEL22059.1 LysR family transcriptional regulator [Bosea sp. F3-2]